MHLEYLYFYISSSTFEGFYNCTNRQTIIIAFKQLDKIFYSLLQLQNRNSYIFMVLYPTFTRGIEPLSRAQRNKISGADYFLLFRANFNFSMIDYRIGASDNNRGRGSIARRSRKRDWPSPSGTHRDEKRPPGRGRGRRSARLDSRSS